MDNNRFPLATDALAYWDPTDEDLEAVAQNVLAAIAPNHMVEE